MKLLTLVLILLLSTSLSSYAVRIGASSDAHDVAVTKVTASPTKVIVIGVVTINVTVENLGTSTETFNVTIHASNHTLTLTHFPLTVTDLAPGLNQTLTFKWEIWPIRAMIFPPTVWPWPPSEPMFENLTIRAEASVVPGEVDTTNNVYADGKVSICWWLIDMNGDGRIDIRDLAILAKSFGQSAGPGWVPGWSPADLNNDGKVDIRDLAGTARSFGATFTYPF